MFLFTPSAPSVTVRPPEKYTVIVPALAPPVWLLTKCQVEIPSQDVVPFAFCRSAATTADGTASAAISAARPNIFRNVFPPSPPPSWSDKGCRPRVVRASPEALDDGRTKCENDQGMARKRPPRPGA